MKTQTTPTLRWEVRYSSDIAGRALYDTFTAVEDANQASIQLEKSFRRHGLPSVAMSVSVSAVGGQRRET